jgi:hypothetical protein
MTKIKDSTYYTERLNLARIEKIRKTEEKGIDKDLDDWDFSEKYSLESHLSTIACFLTATEAMIKALNVSIKDGDFSLKKNI